VTLALWLVSALAVVELWVIVALVNRLLIQSGLPTIKTPKFPSFGQDEAPQPLPRKVAMTIPIGD
jgi:hypothetical protein